MATTEIKYVGVADGVNGITTDFSFPFPYLKIEHVKASIDAVGTTAFTIDPANPTVVSFTVAPTSGSTVRIFRQTPTTATPSVFFSGSAIRSSDLNDNFDTFLYIMQERENGLQDIIQGGIADGSVSTAKLADDSVTSDKLRDDASVDGNRAVTTNHIRDGAVTTLKIANSSVTTAKIADANVTTAKIADANVTTAKIADDAVTGAKLADGAAVKGVAVDQTSYAGTSPITVSEPTTDNKQIDIASTSNAYGVRHVSASLPTSGDGNNGDIWYVT